MTKWYTSDTHFFHKNIIKYSNRPFVNIKEMNEALIANWNSVVKPDDDVYHLGDFAFEDQYWIAKIIERLNGNKHLILGNHDTGFTRDSQPNLKSIQNYKEIYDGGHLIILFHYGCRVWNKSHHGSLQLFGHSHGNLSGTSQSLDVGSDPWKYFPVNIEQIKARMATLPKYTQEDYHEHRDDPAKPSGHHAPR